MDDPWKHLRSFTQARIGLGRFGVALPSREVLAFSLAHAQARDAVLTPINWDGLERGIRDLGQSAVRVASAAPDRATYLRRPDLGRMLSEASREQLLARAYPRHDILIVVADGLSSTGVVANAERFIAAFLPYCQRNHWSLAPILLASQARVAIGDSAAEAVPARASLVLVGERPGLSSPDSLGAYLTFGPRLGRTDAERNCLSNIRAGGLSVDEAAYKAAWLIAEALRRQLTGVQLKDESNFAAISRCESGSLV